MHGDIWAADGLLGLAVFPLVYCFFHFTFRGYLVLYVDTGVGGAVSRNRLDTLNMGNEL